jgi:fructuronate reductase
MASDGATRRLSAAALRALPAAVGRPRYALGKVHCGVVHLGLGGFHRAHQAFVFDRLLNAGHLDWGVVSVGVRSPDLAARLAAQDGLFSVLEREGRSCALTVCGAIRRTLVAAEAPAAVEAAIADPQVQLVTLTITEKGYEGGPIWPMLARGLEQRRAAGAPLTIASCDNLTGNGEVAKAALVADAPPGLAEWIETACLFPGSMVDRIVPAPIAADLDEAAALLGVRDEAAVVTEPFWQWVIEDRFAGARPPLEAAGVQVVSDVAPFERAKLRLLNAAHSALAYAGLLAGFSFVHEAFGWLPLERLVGRLWDEAAATLAPASGLDIARYRAELARRFRNPSLAHRLDQIAMDGSRKLPQRLLPTLAERCAAGAASPALVFALACWLRCLGGHDDADRPIRIVDPALAQLQADMAAGAGGMDRIEAAGMAPPGGVLRAAAPALEDQLRQLRELGVRVALARIDAAL